VPQTDFMVAVTGNLQNSLGALIEIAGAILQSEMNRK
jgi:hypothetical protein